MGTPDSWAENRTSDRKGGDEKSSPALYFLYILIAVVIFSAIFVLWRVGSYNSLLAKNDLYSGCVVVSDCGQYAKIDCNSAADGPLYFADKKDGSMFCLASAGFTPSDWKNPKPCPEELLTGCTEDPILSVINSFSPRNFGREE